jgi:hypothetical protein
VWLTTLALCLERAKLDALGGVLGGVACARADLCGLLDIEASLMRPRLRLRLR